MLLYVECVEFKDDFVQEAMEITSLKSYIKSVKHNHEIKNIDF